MFPLGSQANAHAVSVVAESIRGAARIEGMNNFRSRPQ
jgi:hypothetical protein